MAIDWTYWPSNPAYSQSGSWDWRPPWVTPSKPSTVRWASRQTVAPTVEPVTVAFGKAQLNIVNFTDDDDFIGHLIQAAREYIEMRTGLALMTQTWVLQLDRFPRSDRVELWPTPASPMGAILLPRRPVQSVTSIVWTDQNGATTTVDPATYTVDLNSEPARIALKYNQTWPTSSSTSLAQMAAVQVTFVAGFPTAALVPENYVTALLLMMAHWYANREEVAVDNRLVAIQIPMAADALLGYATPPLVG